MAQLLFFDKSHTYVVDGETVPSVSEILRFMSREIYGNVNQSMLDNASSRGTRVHSATEAIDKYGSVECDDEIIPYVKAYVAFLKQYKPDWLVIEKAMHSKTHGYAGTIDRIGMLDGKRWLIDIKAQEQIKKHYVTAQASGYAAMAEENGTKCERLGCLQLKKDGTYKLHELDSSPELFFSCLTIHKALAPRRRRKAVNE